MEVEVETVVAEESACQLAGNNCIAAARCVSVGTMYVPPRTSHRLTVPSLLSTAHIDASGDISTALTSLSDSGRQQ